MRYKIEKHSDHIHVKEDTSSETAIKIFGWLIALPFILFYFMIVWPLVKLYQYKKKKKAREIESTLKSVEIDGTTYTMLTTEARSLIPELKEQVENILNIISTTADPDVFFDQFVLYEDKLKQLSAAYAICEVPNSALALLHELPNTKGQLTERLIKRYARNSRRKIYELYSVEDKIKCAEIFKNILEEFSDSITDENWSFVKYEYGKLLELCE